jgi:hypothetical protein
MQITKKQVTTTLVLGGLLVIGSIMHSPGSTAQAVYASPVAIANTTASPGMVLDSNLATRIPYQSTASASCGLDFCSFSFSPIPAGYRLIVENLGGRMSMNFGETIAPGLMLSDGAGKVKMGVTSMISGDANTPLATFNTRFTAFYDPALQPLLFATGNFNIGAATGQFATLSGFLVNCSVVGCPPIQQ